MGIYIYMYVCIVYISIHFYYQQMLVLLYTKGPSTKGIFRCSGNMIRINNLVEDIDNCKFIFITLTSTFI